MKRKSLIIAMIFVIGLSFTFVPTKSLAAIAQGWHFAKVVYAGPLFGKIIIKVDASDGSFTDQWLELNTPMQNSLLATALSALSMQQPVRVWVANDPHILAGVTVQTCFSVLLIE
jgi:hypothetical protein